MIRYLAILTSQVLASKLQFIIISLHSKIIGVLIDLRDDSLKLKLVKNDSFFAHNVIETAKVLFYYYIF